MRRLMFLAAAASLFAVAVASAARPAPAALPSVAVTLDVTPAVVVGDDAEWSGTVKLGNLNLPGHVTLTAFYGSDCNGESVATYWHNEGTLSLDLSGGMFYFSEPWMNSYKSFSFEASYQWFGRAVVSECVSMDVSKPSAAPLSTRTPDSIFLCYSAFQVEPGVWPISVARTLLTAGYWQPYAIKGNIAGGTNVGDYHLVCNLAAGQSVSQQFVGGGGDVHPTSEVVVDQVGVYPVVG